MRTVLRSTRVLTPFEVAAHDVLLEEGIISELAPHGSFQGAIDLEERLVCPGFVDLHSDAVEKEIEPRPGADFPLENAIAELDKKLAMSGITTMFHAVAFNDESIVSQRGTEMATAIIRRIQQANRQYLGVDNLIHARYEITSLPSRKIIETLINEGCVQLLSVMDHTPGQGQFKSIETWKRFHLPVYELSDQQADSIIQDKQRNQTAAYEAMQHLLRYAADKSIRLLSHDDDCREKIDLLHNLGVSISEFPLDLSVADYARNKGMGTGMGAPNVVRGKSQSGNVSARDMIKEGVCDFLCSDYHPSSMLQAPYVLHSELGMRLEDAFAMISSAPAKLSGLEDRGSIAPGQIADIVVIEDHWVPKVVLTLKEGSTLYNAIGCICA